MDEAGMVPKKVQKGFSCCFPLQKLIFASYSERKSDLQNVLNGIESTAYPFGEVLMAIYNQCASKSAVGLVPKKVK